MCRAGTCFVTAWDVQLGTVGADGSGVSCPVNLVLAVEGR